MDKDVIDSDSLWEPAGARNEEVIMVHLDVDVVKPCVVSVKYRVIDRLAKAAW